MKFDTIKYIVTASARYITRAVRNTAKRTYKASVRFADAYFKVMFEPMPRRNMPENKPAARPEPPRPAPQAKARDARSGAKGDDYKDILKSGTQLEALPSIQDPSFPAPTGAHKKIIDRVLTLGTWGGEVELHGLAEMLDSTIVVCAVTTPRTAESRRNGGQVEASPYLRINEGAKNTIYLAYDGSHYESLVNPHNEKFTEHDGKISAMLNPAPGDGDCLYHAVNDASGRFSQRVAINTYHMGKQQERVFLEVCGDVPKKVPDLAKRTTKNVYLLYRQHYAVQLRQKLAQHLEAPSYAGMAELSLAAGG